jgi:hypothetical protein
MLAAQGKSSYGLSLAIVEPFMSLEQIFYLSQTIASVAVVGSLVYLGLQVRAGDRNQRALMQQGRAARASQASLATARPELARIWRKGWRETPISRTTNFRSGCCYAGPCY